MSLPSSMPLVVVMPLLKPLPQVLHVKTSFVGPKD